MRKWSFTTFCLSFLVFLLILSLSLILSHSLLETWTIIRSSSEWVRRQRVATRRADATLICWNSQVFRVKEKKQKRKEGEGKSEGAKGKRKIGSAQTWISLSLFLCLSLLFLPSSLPSAPSRTSVDSTPSRTSVDLTDPSTLLSHYSNVRLFFFFTVPLLTLFQLSSSQQIGSEFESKVKKKFFKYLVSKNTFKYSQST